MFGLHSTRKKRKGCATRVYLFDFFLVPLPCPHVYFLDGPPPLRMLASSLIFSFSPRPPQGVQGSAFGTSVFSSGSPWAPHPAAPASIARSPRWPSACASGSRCSLRLPVLIIKIHTSTAHPHPASPGAQCAPKRSRWLLCPLRG